MQDDGKSDNQIALITNQQSQYDSHIAINQHNNDKIINSNDIEDNSQNNYEQKNEADYKRNQEHSFQSHNLQTQLNESPEVIYCTATVKSKRCKCKNKKSSVEVEELHNALQQIHDEYNDIDYSNVKLKYNLLSQASYENNIINPLISASKIATPEQIKQGKVVYCCNYFQSKLKRYSKQIILIFIFAILLQVIGYGVILKSYNHDHVDIAEKMTTPFIIQIVLWICILIFGFSAIFTSKIKLFKLFVVLKQLNALYGLAISIAGIQMGFKKSYDGERKFAHIIISITTFALAIAPVIISQFVIAQLKRFNILLKKIDQSKLNSNNCS